MGREFETIQILLKCWVLLNHGAINIGNNKEAISIIQNWFSNTIPGENFQNNKPFFKLITGIYSNKEIFTLLENATLERKDGGYSLEVSSEIGTFGYPEPEGMRKFWY